MPTSTVGPTWRTTSKQVVRLILAEAVLSHRLVIQGEGTLVRIGDLASLVQQAVSIHEDLGGVDLGLIVGLLPHRHGDQPPNAHPGGSCTRIDDPLVGELLPGDPQRRQHTGHGHRRRALDVVVEAGDLPVVAIQDLEGDVLVEVLPLDETLGKTSFTAATKASRTFQYGSPWRRRCR